MSVANFILKAEMASLTAWHRIGNSAVRRRINVTTGFRDTTVARPQNRLTLREGNIGVIRRTAECIARRTERCLGARNRISADISLRQRPLLIEHRHSRHD